MKSLSRRDFLKFTGLGTVAAATAAALAGCAGTNDAGTTTDTTGTAGTAGTTTTGEGVVTKDTQENTVAEIVEVEGRKFTSMVLTISDDPGTLAPFSPTGGGRNETKQMLYEAMAVTAPATHADYPNLRYTMCKSVTNPAENTYDVEIYDNIYDIEGNHITASDVAYSYQLNIDTGNAAKMAQMLNNIEVLGDYSLRFNLNYDQIGTKDSIVSGANIISQKAWEADPDGMTQKPVGTAPWSLDDWQLGSHYIYNLRDDYWQSDVSLRSEMSMTNIDQVKYEIIKDATTGAMALENFEIDYYQISKADYGNFLNTETYEPLEGFNSILYAANNAQYLSFNCSADSQCQDINLRKALCYCIDNDACGQLGYGSLFVHLKGYMLTAWLNNCVDLLPDNDYYNYDVDKAKEYLAQSNYDGSTLKLLVNPAQQYQQTAVLFQAYAKEIGVDIEVVILESALYEAEHRRLETNLYDMDLVFGKGGHVWAGYQELDINNYTNKLNHNFIYDEKLQSLYEAAMVPEMTPEDALALHDYVKEQAYIYGICSANNVRITTDKITNIVATMTGLIPGACTVVADEDWAHMSARG